MHVKMLYIAFALLFLLAIASRHQKKFKNPKIQKQIRLWSRVIGGVWLLSFVLSMIFVAINGFPE